MLEDSLVLVLTVVLVLVVAGGVVVTLALSRRSARDWKGIIRQESGEKADEVKNHSLSTRANASGDRPVVPRTESLHSLLLSADSSSAYFDADRLPGVERLETVTERVTERLNRGRRMPGADSGSEQGSTPR